MPRSVESLQRRGPKFAPQPTVLIVCEDKVSSKTYLQDAAAWFRANAKIKVAHAGVTHPLGIVEFAVKQKTKYDIVYCAIDRDTHESFDAAIELASRHSNVEIIASYPCFEIWLLVHFGMCGKPFVAKGNKSPGDCVEHELKTKPEMNDYDKGKTKGLFAKLQGEKFTSAMKFSPIMLAEAHKVGSMNPSTAIHLLMSDIRDLGEPIALNKK
jgi:hypothetical protein